LKNISPTTIDNISIYIIEKLPDIVPSFEGLVISLVPEVSYQLSKIGVAYSIPEDFLPMQELYSEMTVYIELFDEWLNGLDESLLQHFKKLKLLNVKPARLYGYWLGWIVGSYVTNSLFIKTILEKTKPSKVIYFRPEERSKPTGIDIWKEKETIPSILIPVICKNKDIELQEVIVEDVISKKEGKFRTNISRLETFKNVCNWSSRGTQSCGNLTIYQSVIRLLRTARNDLRRGVYKIYKLMKLLSNNILGIVLKKNAILSLHYGGWEIEEILKSARRAGYQVRYISKKSFNESVGCDINLINEIDLNMKLFNDFVGFDLSEVLKKKVKYFIEEIVPKLEIAVPKYQEVFIKKRISIVLGYSKSTFAEHSIIAAAVASTSTLAVLFSHGWNALYSPFKDSLSEGPCDLYLTFDKEMKEYHSVSVFKNKDVIVEKSPLWVNKRTNIRGNRKTHRPHNRPLVLYIPTLFIGDLARPDLFFYSSCWYFEHQMKLLQYFATEKEFYFIWKGFPQAETTRNPIPDVIKENGYDNIEFSSGQLVDYIISADYSIIDFPSTPLYEAVASGLPALALCHESFRIRNTAKALFGDILAQFSTTEESIGKISDFLRSNPERFVVNIDVPEDIDFEVIERHAKNKCHVG
jgi:hypothetical protein